MAVTTRRLSILVLGGTGFVGRHLCARLIHDGHSVRVLTRNRERHRPLWVLPGLELVNANVHAPDALARHVRGRDAVVNLVGILNERGFRGEGFRAAHSDLARAVVGACRAAGVPRLLHMSALGAAVDGPSHYLRSKGEAERLIRSDGGAIAWTIFRPSVIFGADDGFTRRFQRLLALAPVLPLVRASAELAPVWVGDVVAALIAVLEAPTATTAGQTYELCGPQRMTLAQAVRAVGAQAGLKRWVLPVPDALGALMAAVLGLLPGKPLSLDNFRSLSLASVCAENGFARLNLKPQSLHSVMSVYLGRHLPPTLAAL